MHSAGVTVTVTSMDASTASAYERATGSKNEPLTPAMKNTGSTTSRMTSVAKPIGLDISAAACWMIAVGPPLPSPRWLRRRRAFWTAITASSITTPTATARPANTTALRADSVTDRTSAAAVSDTPNAMKQISAVRHSKRKTNRASARRRQPMITARVRLSVASLMKSAGRKTDEVTCTPERPGRRSSSASSTPWVTSSVLAPGAFSMTSSRPVRPLTTASPISGWWSSTTRLASPRRSWLALPPPRPSIGTSASLSAVRVGRMCRMWSLWLGVSKNPPVPGVEASRKLSGETIWAFPAVRTTWPKVTCLSRICAGSTRT